MKKGLTLLAAAALLSLGACGDDEDEGTSAKVQTLSVSVNAQGRLIGIAPVKGGPVRIDFRNDSKSPYDLQIVRVDGGQSLPQVMRVIEGGEGGPIPNWLHGAGGVGATKPGRSTSATQILPAGRYYAIANPDTEGEQEVEPATAAFRVQGGESDGELPSAPATVTATEYAFEAEGLKQGRNRIRFVNDGDELHHIVAFQLAPGKTVADVKRFFRTEKGRPPIVEGVESSTAVIDGKTEQIVDMEFANAGKWALVCFISDRKGGPSHAAKGMISEVEVG
ncbi:MAG: hypothetical protein M3141_05020 [Actinomycetota bacterium]|nr:hypothetical protein [Actinomycetota bacterium]